MSFAMCQSVCVSVSECVITSVAIIRYAGGMVSWNIYYNNLHRRSSAKKKKAAATRRRETEQLAYSSGNEQIPAIKL